MLEYIINQLKEAVVFQIVDQDSKIDDFLKRVGTFTASNGYKVKIDKHPEIDAEKKFIFLRGSDEYKRNIVFTVYGVSDKDAKKLVEDVKKALKELVAAVKEAKVFYRPELNRQLFVSPVMFDPYGLRQMIGGNRTIIIIEE